MVSVINFPGPKEKPPAAAAAAPPNDTVDDTIADLRIEHVTYYHEGQKCEVMNVMFRHDGKQKSSRYHYHLSQHAAHGAVVNSLRRKK